MFTVITIPVTEIPLVSPGDDVGGLLLNGLSENEIELKNGDMIVVAQTIVSKAEGNVVNLESVRPSSEAERFGEELGKDPRKMEMILRETESIVGKLTFSFLKPSMDLSVQTPG